VAPTRRFTGTPGARPWSAREMCILSEKPHNVNAFKTSSLLILSAFSASTRRGDSSRALTGRTPEVPVTSGSNLASIEPELSPVRGGARSGAEPGPGRSPACCSLEPPITAVWEPEQPFLVVRNEQGRPTGGQWRPKVGQ